MDKQGSVFPAGIIFDGKWRIEAPLGSGGMGTVYAATHTRNGLRVAVKVLHSSIVRDEVARKRFLHEGYAANRVDHPATVRVLDDGQTDDGRPYLVMERLDGMSLDAVAERAGGVLPVADVLRYALLWLDVIATAHAHGIIHRDLKPENVFVCTDGKLKVLDFGLARMREFQSKARLTVEGVPMGTPAFMPPEQALALWDKVDATSDVYSLAASLFNLMSGRLVHEGRTVPEIIVLTTTRHAAPVRQVAPQIPQPVAQVLDRALAYEQEARYATAGAMLDALRAAMSNLELQSVHTTMQGAGPGSYDGDRTVRVDQPPASTVTAGPLVGSGKTDPIPGRHLQFADPRPGRPLALGGYPPPPEVRSEAPVSRPGTGRGRRRSRYPIGVLVACFLGAAGLTTGAVLLLRGWSPGAAGAPASSSTLPSATATEPSASGTGTATQETSAATVAVSADPSASAVPSASASAKKKKPPSDKPCKRDKFTLKCPCAKCI